MCILYYNITMLRYILIGEGAAGCLSVNLFNSEEHSRCLHFSGVAGETK
jgi:hypothetical protein